MCMAETVYALLCDHGIEWDVPRLPRQLIYMLKVMRQTDQLGTVPMSALLFEGKSAVVITASHAQAIAIVVESDQGYPMSARSIFNCSWFPSVPLYAGLCSVLRKQTG